MSRMVSSSLSRSQRHFYFYLAGANELQLWIIYTLCFNSSSTWIPNLYRQLSAIYANTLVSITDRDVQTAAREPNVQCLLLMKRYRSLNNLSLYWSLNVLFLYRSLDSLCLYWSLNVLSYIGPLTACAYTGPLTSCSYNGPLATCPYIGPLMLSLYRSLDNPSLNLYLYRPL